MTTSDTHMHAPLKDSKRRNNMATLQERLIKGVGVVRCPVRVLTPRDIILTLLLPGTHTELCRTPCKCPSSFSGSDSSLHLCDHLLKCD